MIKTIRRISEKIDEKITDKKLKLLYKVIDYLFLPQTDSDDWIRGIIFVGLLLAICDVIALIIEIITGVF